MTCTRKKMDPIDVQIEIQKGKEEKKNKLSTVKQKARKRKKTREYADMQTGNSAGGV